MRIVIVCPAPRGSRAGNRVTALRWGRLLRALGHRVVVSTSANRACDLLIALHARHSAAEIQKSRSEHPTRPIVLVMTGTDLYRDIASDRSAHQSLDLADVLVVLHSLGAEALPRKHRGKVVVVPQSATPVPHARKRGTTFDVAVVGHLREEKDPLRTALAVRNLPASSRIRAVQVGRALSSADGEAAAAAESTHYRWVGERSPSAARRLIARSDLLVLTSRMEGGANVLSEALVSDTPIVASRIPAARALLGDEYPGLFRVGSTRGLRALLLRAERDPSFLRELTRKCRARRKLVSVAAERAGLRSVLARAALTRSIG